MIFFGNQKNDSRVNAAIVDKENVAFYVADNEVDHIADFLTASIIASCLMEYGISPEELD